MKLFSLLILMLICGGCAVGGEITKIDDNVYLLTEVDMKLGFGPVRSGIIKSTYDQANNYCAEKNKKVKRLNHSQKDAAVGSPASFTLEFSCVDN